MTTTFEVFCFLINIKTKPLEQRLFRSLILSIQIVPLHFMSLQLNVDFLLLVVFQTVVFRSLQVFRCEEV